MYLSLFQILSTPSFLPSLPFLLGVPPLYLLLSCSTVSSRPRADTYLLSKLSKNKTSIYTIFTFSAVQTKSVNITSMRPQCEWQSDVGVKAQRASIIPGVKYNYYACREHIRGQASLQVHSHVLMAAGYREFFTMPRYVSVSLSLSLSVPLPVFTVRSLLLLS